MLEPYDGKLSRTVLRGERGREAPDLPDSDRYAVRPIARRMSRAPSAERYPPKKISGNNQRKELTQHYK